MGGAVKVDLRFDDRDLKAGIESLRQKFPQAVRRAVLRAGNSGKTVMVRLIAADLGIAQKRIRDEIRVSQVGEAGVQLEVVGGRIPLIEFNARGPEPSHGRGSGVSYRLPSGQGRAEHAFIATMKGPQGGLHRGVFQRRGPHRTPVVELKGPSIAHVFAKYLDEGAARAQEALVTNMRSEIAFALSRR